MCVGGRGPELWKRACVRVCICVRVFTYISLSYLEFQRVARDIDCDVWVSVKDDWPANQPFETHWEWYFATVSYYAHCIGTQCHYHRCRRRHFSSYINPIYQRR